jgi:hypothetical protein
MATTKKTDNPNRYLEAIAFYPKLLTPQPAFKPRDPKEWVVDVILTEEGMKEAAKAGIKTEDGTSKNAKGDLTSKAKSVAKYQAEIKRFNQMSDEEFAGMFGDAGMDAQYLADLREVYRGAENGGLIRATKKQRETNTPAPKLYANGEHGLVQIPNDRIQIGNGSRIVVGLLPVTLGTEKPFGEYNTVLSTVNIKDLVPYTKASKSQGSSGSFVFDEATTVPFEAEDDSTPFDVDAEPVEDIDIYAAAPKKRTAK